jgi:hypothetical protein
MRLVNFSSNYDAISGNIYDGVCSFCPLPNDLMHKVLVSQSVEINHGINQFHSAITWYFSFKNRKLASVLMLIDII